MLIDQYLHGYNNGHHLIASSASLPLKDADRMSYQSDWSGYVNPFNKETSYITAYPLAESHSYVIAMSWYAEEMSRPGCVWTHSLVVKLDALGQKFNFFDLLKLFRRPEREGEDFLFYTKPVELSDNGAQETRKPLDGIDQTRFMFMAALLFDRQKPAVYMLEREGGFYTELCLRLIQNMPYGILKDLSICSGSATARKFEKVFYNLQFVTGKGESLVEPIPQNMSKPKADAGFQLWMDAVLEGRSDVAQMLHRFSGDIGNDSNKFLATLNLLRLLDEKIKGISDSSSIKDVIHHLTEGFAEKESGALLKRSFLGEGVSQYFCDERTFILTLATVDKDKVFDFNEIGFDARVSAYRMTQGMENYVSLLVELSKADYLNEEGKKLLSNALVGLSTEEIVVLLGKDWSLFKSIVTMNNQLLAEEFWLDLMPPQFVSLFAIFQRNIPTGFTAWEKLYKKLLTIDTFVADNVQLEFVNHITDYVTIALDQWNARKKIPINQAILKMCMKQHSRVILWMGQQKEINNDIRKAIKRNIAPDEAAVVNLGSKAWKAFVNDEMQVLTDANDMVYIYVLAFNWHDDDALSYIRKTLPYIYEALSLETFSQTSWNRIEKFTGSVPFWRSWDNCRKVLIGVRDYCKNMNLKDADIENFTTNRKLNGELIELWRKR